MLKSNDKDIATSGSETSAESFASKFPELEIARICNLHQKLPVELQQKYKKRYQELLADLTEDAGVFLMEEMDARKHSIDQVKAVVTATPASLAYCDDDGYLPIQVASLKRNSIPFVPYLAQEGVKHQVGGEGMRGGLLVEDRKGGLSSISISASASTVSASSRKLASIDAETRLYDDDDDNRDDNENDHGITENGINVLQVLASRSFLTKFIKRSAPSDTIYLDALKDLHKNGLLLKEDIETYSLIMLSCVPSCQKRFEYFTNWDPDGLKEHKYNGKYVFNAVANSELDSHVNSQGIEAFAMVLKAGMKYFPKEIGFLFRKDCFDPQTSPHGQVQATTPCEVAFDRYGKKKTMRVIRDCIPIASRQLGADLMLTYCAGQTANWMHEMELEWYKKVNNLQ